MIAFTDTLLFLLATGALFFVPGWLLLKLFLKRGAVLTPIETFVLSFVVGLEPPQFRDDSPRTGRAYASPHSH
jgi:hypothetical protein